MKNDMALITELKRKRGLLKGIKETKAAQTELVRGKPLLKFNENHDNRGRFASGGGGFNPSGPQTGHKPSGDKTPIKLPARPKPGAQGPNTFNPSGPQGIRGRNPLTTADANGTLLIETPNGLAKYVREEYNSIGTDLWGENTPGKAEYLDVLRDRLSEIFQHSKLWGSMSKRDQDKLLLSVGP